MLQLLTLVSVLKLHQFINGSAPKSLATFESRGPAIFWRYRGNKSRRFANFLTRLGVKNQFCSLVMIFHFFKEWNREFVNESHVLR